MSPCLSLTGKLSYVTLAVDLIGTPSIPVFLVLIRVELSGLFEEISQFSVDHLNVGYESVSRALDSPPGLPSLCSPHLGKIYKWRVSNFYGSRKSNGNPRIIQQCNERNVKSLVWNLKNGNYLP